MHNCSSRIFRSLAALVALSAVIALASNNPVNAQSESPVQISGIVKDSTGKPAAAVQINLFKVDYNPGAEVGGGGRGGSGGKRDSFGQPEVIEMQNKMGKKVAQAVSDANGGYVFKSVKPGTYRFTAGNAKTTGAAGGPLEVAAGQNMTFEINLQPPQR